MSLNDFMSSDDEDVVMIDQGDVSDYNEANILPEPSATLERIRAWLRPTAYDLESSEYHKHLAAHLPGTGKWLTCSSTYLQWRDGVVHGMLWLKGAPGSGKSVFAAVLADQLSRADEGLPVLHFFFRHIVDANHAPVAQQGDWLAQVLLYSPPLQRQLKEYVQGGRSLESLAVDDLWQDLRTAIFSLPGRLYCIADALDEMDGGNDDFLRALADLGRWMPDRVKVLVTSRPVPSLEAPLRSATCLQIRLQEKLVDIDIAAYIRHSLEDSSLSPTNRGLVLEAVLRRANGLFLYAKLAVDGFRKPEADLQEVFRLLPDDLNGVYTDLLREHARRSAVPDDVQLLILQWVTHSTRPLRVLELAELISATHLPRGIWDFKARKSLIGAACGPLLEILADETVSMVHHSFTEYLTGSTRSPSTATVTTGGYPVLEYGPTHAQLALACLAYLQSGCLGQWRVKMWSTKDRFDSTPRTNSQLSNLRLTYPFVKYAIDNWYIHTQRACAAGFDPREIHKVLDEFLTNGQVVEAWAEINWHDDAMEGITPLHIAARIGLSQYVHTLLNRSDTEVNVRDSQGNTPLLWAAYNGHAEIIQQLLQAGGKSDLDNDGGLKPLHQAARNNHSDAVRLLLDAGVNPLTPQTKVRDELRARGYRKPEEGKTPLMYACENGHVNVVDSFLPFLHLPAIHQALAWAVSSARARVVERILRQPGVDVNAKFHGDTFLFLACKNGDPNIISALIRAGADPNILCDNAEDEFEHGLCSLSPGLELSTKDSSRGYTALHVLHHGPTSCRRPDRLEFEKLKACFSLLIEAGANVHQRDPKGRTPLHHAASCPTKIALLMEARADVNAKSDDGVTVMQMEVFVNDVDTVRLLTKDEQVDNDKGAQSKGQILLSMLGTGNFGDALKFVECRPDCNITDGEGNSALHYAVRRSRTDNTQLVKALLNQGANPNMKNRDGETPLHEITFLDSQNDLVSLLLSAGTEIDARYNAGRTWLFRSYTTFSINEIQRCLDLGAHLDTRDFNGRTMLHIAVGIGAHNLANRKFLIETGLDPKAVDYSGNTSFHEAVQAGSFSLFEELSELGLDPDQANYAGRTPLHFLCSLGLDEAIDFKGKDPVQTFLSFSKRVDAMDHQGSRPLHLAATASEHLVAALLKAGADPISATHEGLTALHLAARARQSNIVGMLITALRGANRPNMKSLINARDKEGRTPLHYACRSGRPETVTLLLDAGANPDLADEWSETPLQACADFEEEQELWGGYGKVTEKERDDFKQFGRVDLAGVNIVCAGGTKLNDRSRPFVCLGKELRKDSSKDSLTEINSSQDTTRLCEILEMLHEKLSKSTKDSSETANTVGWIIKQAEQVGNDYTAGCFNQLQARLQTATTSPLLDSNGFKELFTKYRREVAIRALHDSNQISRGSHNCEILMQILRMREYALVEEMFYEGADFLDSWTWYDNETNLHLLAQRGFAVLLERLGTLEAEAKYKEGKWHAAGNSQRPGLGVCLKGPGFVEPLLLTACQRKLPNMDVVLVLVHKLGVDVNARSQENVPSRGSGESVTGGVNALHALARGHHWWHAAQAIPFLITHAGADIELRNLCGETPLQIALDSPGVFQKQAAQTLVQLGADVNTVDRNGRSCLARAVKDADLFRLLLARGAKLSATVLFATIDGHNMEVLEALLSNGVEANIRSDPADDGKVLQERAQNWARGHFPSELDMDKHEWYPLHYAASTRSQAWVSPPRMCMDRNKRVRQMVSLLAHGADPYAIFTQPVRPQKMPYAAHSVTWEDDDDQSSSPIQYAQHAQHSVIHALLEEGSLVQPVLELPTLQLERWDPQGRTLLLAACRSALGADASIDATLFDIEWDVNNGTYERDPFSDPNRVTALQLLLARGANPTARDKHGKNALHHLLEAYDNRTQNGRPPIVRASLKQLATSFPTLLSQPDNAGNYPLHAALRQLHRYERVGRYRDYAEIEAVVEDLIRAGADPHARDGRGNTALHYLAVGLAEQFGADEQRRLCRFFLELGVDVNARNAKGQTALFALFDDDGHRAKDRLQWFRFEARNSGLPSAAEVDEAVLGWFERAGVEWSVGDRMGRTLLHIVARHNTPRAVGRFKHLMKKQVDPMLEDGDQRTALDVAAACGNRGVLDLFKQEDI